MVKESRKSPDFKGEHSSTAYKQNTQKSQWSNCGRREDARISLLGVSRTTGGPLGKNWFSTPPVAGCVLTLSQASCMTLGKSVLEKLLLWYTLVMRRGMWHSQLGFCYTIQLLASRSRVWVDKETNTKEDLAIGCSSYILMFLWIWSCGEGRCVFCLICLLV